MAIVGYCYLFTSAVVYQGFVKGFERTLSAALLVSVQGIYNALSQPDYTTAQHSDRFIPRFFGRSLPYIINNLCFTARGDSRTCWQMSEILEIDCIQGINLSKDWRKKINPVKQNKSPRRKEKKNTRNIKDQHRTQLDMSQGQTRRHIFH